jgi:triacylglycerol lipase
VRLALPLVLLAACQPAGPSPCDRLKKDLSNCLGTSAARLDCSTVADADVERLESLIEGSSCEEIVSAIPLDGELASATCRAFGVGCVAPVSPAPVAAPTRYPLVLVNGIDTSPLFRYEPRIIDVLTNEGAQTVYLATLTPWEPPTRRAPELWSRVQEVLKATGAQKVNLICHSLGGLDCRYLVSPNGLALDSGDASISSVVASITTVGTAHRGTRIADVMLGELPDQKRGQVIDDFASLAGDWFSDNAIREDADVSAALHALSTDQAAAFNLEIVDAPGVYYQSFAGFSRPFAESNAALDARAAAECTPDEPSNAVASSHAVDAMTLVLAPFDQVVGTEGDVLQPHDGLVTVASAKWGNFRGCIPADHMEQLGQRNLPDVNVLTGVDVASFYAAVAADLAGRGL